MGINGGRNLRGIENVSCFKDYHVSLPNDLVERLEKFQREEDRNRSWTIQKALDEYLRKRGLKAPSFFSFNGQKLLLPFVVGSSTGVPHSIPFGSVATHTDTSSFALYTLNGQAAHAHGSFNPSTTIAISLPSVLSLLIF